MRRIFAKARSVAISRANIGRMSFAGSTVACLSECLNIDSIFQCTIAGSSMASRTGLSFSMTVSLCFYIGHPAVWFEHKIADDVLRSD
jgi:hypothetical protein